MATAIIIGAPRKRRNRSNMRKIQIIELLNSGDARGPSFSTPAEALAFVGDLGDVHVVSARPGAIRGNHLHLRRREALLVLPGANWSLHWNERESLRPEHRDFDGSSAMLVLVPPGAAHAVRNDGDRDLWRMVISSGAYDPAETVRRQLV